MTHREQKLAGKRALVTGASRGIGRAIALGFARAGASVAVAYHTNREPADALASELLALGVESFSLPLEVTNRVGVHTAVEEVVKRWGTLDILVNNAGYLEQKPFDEITDEDWEHTLAVDLKGVFICTQEVARIFKRQKSGCIINLSSVGGQTGGVKAPHYAAAKAGVISFTKSAAKLLAPHTRVNAIAPGFIRTDMYRDIVSRSSEADILSQIPLGRVGEPDDVARAAVFLASDDASYITGHVLNINGGLFFG